MILYENRLSGNCWKVRQILALRGLAYESRELDVVDRSDRAAVLGELNPALRVPTLVLDDGRVLAESGAILWYFGEDCGLVPRDRFLRAQVLQWMFFEQYSHEPNIAVARFWVTIRPGDPPPELAERHAGGYAALDAMEQRLTDREFLLDAFTIADLALYAYTHVAHEGGFQMQRYPAIRRWLERVAGQPGHIPM